MQNPKTPYPTPDPVVEEVRAIRRRLWADAGKNVERFLQRLDRDVPWEQIPRRRRGGLPTGEAKE